MKPGIPWKIGFNTFWWEGLDREDVLRGCLEALVDTGYEAVEFKVDSFGPHPNRDAVVRAAAAARKAGLTVSNLVILRNLSQAQAAQAGVRDVAEAVRICAAADIGALNFTTGGAGQVPAASEEEWWVPPTRQDPAAWDTLTRFVADCTYCGFGNPQYRALAEKTLLLGLRRAGLPEE